MGLFTYQSVPMAGFRGDVQRIELERAGAFLMALPEKALAEKVRAERGTGISTQRELETFVLDHLRVDPAALTALALFAAFMKTANVTSIDVSRPYIMAGLLIGAMLPFVFSALAMNAVGRAAMSMIEEVRRQFRDIPELHAALEVMRKYDSDMTKASEADRKIFDAADGKAEYEKCVEISTKASIKEMVLPGLMAIAVPVAIGFIGGAEMLGGLLAGVTTAGVLMAIFQSNAGGAWDNAKKWIETGELGGKGSDSHKAAVIGDTVGDPFNDTSGSSLNILIKLIAIVSVVFAGLVVSVSPKVIALLGLAATPAATLAEDHYDVSYLWHRDISSVRDYRERVAKVLGPRVAKNLRVVAKGNLFGLVYSRRGDNAGAARVARKHTRLLKAQGLEVAAPVRSRNWALPGGQSLLSASITRPGRKKSYTGKPLAATSSCSPLPYSAWISGSRVSPCFVASSLSRPRYSQVPGSLKKLDLPGSLCT